MLIAATGFAGAGKTTALRYLATLGVGNYFYAGGIVTRAVARRGLPPGPASERLVRDALRAEGGMAALAVCAEPELRALLTSAPAVLIDAICNAEEADFYREHFGGEIFLLALDAPFAQRAARLAERPLRPMSARELEARDHYETEKLRLDTVIARADFTLSNTAGMDELKLGLRNLAAQHLSR
ncbi:hypothetical protein E2493_09385 [Sphingomonas parva]|uniref:Dephospho-CoA kinase n=1 Tax=Sphingomonas parva TaxID=2555898 RepID=A0A4Y8ZRG8_9SPHN|nr:AAA family ATPase [Sphingomonas parva]TFI58621.1 hypothetical protein E2493_09385 [Sphingomonas parva]